MELKVKPFTPPEALSCNYDELKTALLEKTAQYETMVYTDDQVQVAKADRAALNKLKKALNDERIRQEREYMKPFATFKAQITELISLIDRPVQAIDAQVKAFDERRKEERRTAILDYWKGTGAPEWMHTCKPSWLNASYSMKTIQAEIDANIEQANKDLAVILKLPEYAFEAEEHYKATQSLSEAISEANRLKEMALRKAAHEAEKAAQQAVPEPATTTTVPKREIPVREWIAFKALLTPDEALHLGNYMKSHGILYKAV